MSKYQHLEKRRLESNDEIYTTKEICEEVLSPFLPLLRGRIVYCNCDNPLESEIVKFFCSNFREFGLKRVVATCFCKGGHGLYGEINTVPSALGDFSGIYSLEGNILRELKGDGDFRSEECQEILSKADVCVTNPPFSLLRHFFIKQMILSGKDFLFFAPLFAIRAEKKSLAERKLFVYRRIALPFVTERGEFISLGNVALMGSFPRRDEKKEANTIALPEKPEKFLPVLGPAGKRWYIIPTLSSFPLVYVPKTRDVGRNEGRFVQVVSLSALTILDFNYFAIVGGGEAYYCSEGERKKAFSRIFIYPKHLLPS